MKSLKRMMLELYRNLLWQLPQSWVAEMFRQAGERLNVRSCACDGELGIYEARLSDRGVMGYYLVHGTWEPQIQKLLAGLVLPGTGTFIDVGANVGFTTIPLRHAFPNLKLVGVEADAENFGYLMRNLARNGIDDAVIHQRAVYFEDGELAFELSGHNAGDNRIHQASAGGKNRYDEAARKVVRVKCARLDTLVAADALQLPVGIKCDIQGAEVHFFKGASAVLDRTEWLVVEYWPYGIVRAGSDPKEFFRLLSRHFQVGGIIEGADRSGLIPIAELETLVAEQLAGDDATAHRELLFQKIAPNNR